jgi:hypothetical protein
MALQAAAMMAFFMDSAQQAPIQIQCVQQAAPDSWVKWLLPTIVQTVVSLASITAGVLIAVVSFRKNKKTEHEQWLRNQKAGHEQWIRDQKKAEWRELLDALNATYLPMTKAKQSCRALNSADLLVINKFIMAVDDRMFIDEEARRSLHRKFNTFNDKYQKSSPIDMSVMTELKQLIEEAREDAKKDVKS